MIDSIKLLLVEDHILVRDGINKLLSSENDIEILGEADNGEEAILLAKKMLPDVIIMDIAMPKMNGLEASKEILNQIDTKIILLSMYSDEEYVLEAIQAGVSGYLHKQTAASTLIDAVRKVKNGEVYFSPSISKTILRAAKRKTRKSSQTSALERLTPREKQVLILIAEGVSAKSIGRQLFISMPTVYKHRQNIMNKTEIHNIVGLTKFALKHKLIFK